MGPFRKFPKTRIPEKSGKVTCLTIQKDFTNTHVFQRRPLDCTRTKSTYHSIITQNVKRNKNLIFLMADIALRYTVKTSFAVKSCLPMKVCESEVYKNIVQPLDTHCSCFFSEKYESSYACSHQNLNKISEGKNSIQSHSYHLAKRFPNPPATQEIKL